MGSRAAHSSSMDDARRSPPTTRTFRGMRNTAATVDRIESCVQGGEGRRVPRQSASPPQRERGPGLLDGAGPAPPSRGAEGFVSHRQDLGAERRQRRPVGAERCLKDAEGDERRRVRPGDDGQLQERGEGVGAGGSRQPQAEKWWRSAGGTFVPGGGVFRVMSAGAARREGHGGGAEDPVEEGVHGGSALLQEDVDEAAGELAHHEEGEGDPVRRHAALQRWRRFGG